MTHYPFDSSMTLGPPIGTFDMHTIKNEPMLFSCDLERAWRLGGPITQDFLHALTLDGLERPNLIIDTRVHMLMPGWYPAIPGWHHDDVPRDESGQPDYEAPAYRSQHAMALINADVAPTEFALGKCALLKPEPGEITYGKWHPLVEGLVRAGKLKRFEAPNARVIFFDWQAFHQAVPAVKTGWRWFGRASWDTHRTPTNEVRRQVQVYLPNPMQGW